MPKKQAVRAQQTYPRLDLFLCGAFPGYSRNQIEKLILGRKVWLNHRPASKKSSEVAAGDLIEVEFPEEQSSSASFPGSGLKLSAEPPKLYEDDVLLVIDKPSGIPVHPGAGPREETVLDWFADRYPDIGKMADIQRPGIIHRLDRGTSGVLVLAKDAITMIRMQKKFKKRQVSKTYLALVSGRMRQRNGVIDAPIIRHPRKRKMYTVPRQPSPGRGRDASTGYSVLLESDGWSFLKLKPETGRTHQLRVHLSHLHHPILGDDLYGRSQEFERLALHASSVSFDHPSTGFRLTINAPLPGLFLRFIRAEIRSKKT